MYFDEPPFDDIVVARQKYSQNKTFKGKFEVAWKLLAPYIIESRDKLYKTSGNSMLWREIGNKEYTTAKNKDYLRKSIEAYTKSIAFAPVGSSELSLVYANRSVVLFKARLYEDCLLDIERSLKSDYPDKLKTKLFLRQSLCFKALKPSSHIETGISKANAIQWLPYLKKYNPTYDITKEYPKMIDELKEPREVIKFIPEIKNDNAIIVGASDAIELKRTNENNQHIVATRDIKSGEFVYLYEPFAATVSDELRFTNCWHCCRSTWAGVPCDNCSAIIYCSDICKKKAWNSYHNIECLVLGPLLKSDQITPDHLLTVKLFLKTLNTVGGLIELKKKIDNIDSMKNKKLILTNGILDGNTIDNFHRLDFFGPVSCECIFECALIAVWIVAIFGQKTNILGQKMTLKDLIKSKDKKILILGELVLRYIMIVHRNTGFCQEQPDDRFEYSNVMVPFAKLIKKNCDPNVRWNHLGSNIGFFASQPIKQGEPILMTNVGSYHSVTKINRFSCLKSTTDDLVPCRCTACDENWPVIDYLPSYRSMMLPTTIEGELDRMMGTLKKWRYILSSKNAKQLTTIKNDLGKMNDKLHQYITGPCKEKSLLYLSLQGLYCDLLKIYDTLE